MTELLVRNAKIAKANTAHADLSVYNFGIPALQSRTGLVTCPMAGQCAKGCYAQQGAYAWTPVQNAYEYRLARTQLDSFTTEMSDAIRTKLRTADRAGKKLVIRIHDSGDFYSADYAADWLQIVASNPRVHFYAYTKQVVMFQLLRKAGRIPGNMVIIYSEGGKADSRIDTSTDRHARVFASQAELEAAGYSNATADDMVAALGTSNKIGLVFHGYKSTAWTTGNAA